jgi:hypothetical protein
MVKQKKNAKEFIEADKNSTFRGPPSLHPGNSLNAGTQNVFIKPVAGQSDSKPPPGTTLKQNNISRLLTK